MNSNRRIKVNEVINHLGVRSIFVSLLAFVLTISITFVVGYQYYHTTKERIYLQGKVNAVQSSKEFESYLLVRLNTLELASHVVDKLLTEGKTNADVLEYLTQESLSIKMTIQAGMNAHLAKPVDIDLLKKTLSGLLGSGKGAD